MKAAVLFVTGDLLVWRSVAMVIAITLYLFALLLLSTLERYADWRDRRGFSRAAALQLGADEVVIPSTVVEPASAGSEAAASEVANRRPWFGQRPRLLDGGDVVTRSTWGPN